MDRFEFADQILDLSLTYNFSVTSWIRTVKHNTAVGGAVNSKHIHGLAVDIVFDDAVSHQEFIYHAENIGLNVIIEKTHLHVEAM